MTYVLMMIFVTMSGDTIYYNRSVSSHELCEAVGADLRYNLGSAIKRFEFSCIPDKAFRKDVYLVE